jgi:endogenous inhibitor of DNA gyrase (YacG/DUF329 family)
MGDPACWINRVCPACGRMIEREPSEGRCPYCAEELDDDILEATSGDG